MNEISNLRRQKEEQLKLLAREVEALRIAERLLEDTKQNPTPSDSSSPTQPEMVRVVLAEKGEPMNVPKISDAIRKKFGKKFTVPYLTSILYRAIKKRKLFYKVPDKVGTFGLIEWQLRTTLSMPVEMNVANR